MIVEMPSSVLCFVMVDEQFQVVVIAANMGCNGCRRRVFRVVSRMTGRFQTLFFLWRNM